MPCLYVDEKSPIFFIRPVKPFRASERPKQQIKKEIQLKPVSKAAEINAIPKNILIKNHIINISTGKLVCQTQ